jgi:hypothetical protein
MNFTTDQHISPDCKPKVPLQKPDSLPPPPAQNKYDPIKKKAPLIKSKNTRYYFDPFFDYPTKIRYFDFKKNEFFYSFSQNQGDTIYENDINPE